MRRKTVSLFEDQAKRLEELSAEMDVAESLLVRVALQEVWSLQSSRPPQDYHVGRAVAAKEFLRAPGSLLTRAREVVGAVEEIVGAVDEHVDWPDALPGAPADVMYRTRQDLASFWYDLKRDDDGYEWTKTADSHVEPGHASDVRELSESIWFKVIRPDERGIAYGDEEKILDAIEDAVGRVVEARLDLRGPEDVELFKPSGEDVEPFPPG